MEFWGTEVAPGKPQVNEPGDDTYVHVSQAALGPSKDGKSERVVVRVETGGKNVVLGTLCSGKVDQMTLDLIFDREFKLSHTSTSSSVFFCGYRTDKQQDYDDDSEEDEDEEDDEEDDEPVPTAVPIKQNGTVSVKEEVKASKKQLKAVEKVVDGKPKKAETPKPSLIDQEAVEGEESDDDDDDEEADKAIKMDFGTDDYDEEDDSEFEVDESGSDLESDEDEDDEDSDEDDSDEDDENEDDEDDIAAELGKKRSLQVSAKKAAGEGKKPRLDTPAKPGSQTAAEYWESLIIAGGKGLITTPSAKKGAKGAADTKSTPVSTKKEAKEAKGTVAKTPQKTPGKEAKEAKTPKTTTPATPGGGESAKKIGTHVCAECKRIFTSESALSQHDVAKHKK